MIRHLRNFARDKGGVSAVEFALLLPVMTALYFGVVEVSQALSIDRKVTLTARTVADLASQVTSINDADMTNLLKASSAVISPYPANMLKVTVSLVKVGAAGTATVTWSDTLNGTARAKGSSVTLPEALRTPDLSLVWSEVQYDYTPTIGYVLTGTLHLKEQLYMRPRLSDTVARPVT